MCKVEPIREARFWERFAWDCKEDSVRLSSHMDKHWKEIGFVPQTNSALYEEEDGLEIQIGKDKIEDQISQGPNLAHRYSSILVSGFWVD